MLISKLALQFVDTHDLPCLYQANEWQFKFDIFFGQFKFDTYMQKCRSMIILQKYTYLATPN